MRRLGTLFLLVLLLSACEDVIDIDIDKNSNNIVVEGWVTDLPGPQKVLLSRANGFNSTLPNPSIDSASIIVFTSVGTTHSYRFASNGVYLSDSSFIGIPGYQYLLQVILADGDTVTSTFEQLVEVHSIDSIGYTSYLTPSPDNPREDIEVFFPIAYAVDPGNIVNQYKWNLYRNDTLFSEAEEIFLLNDRFYNGNSYRNEFTDYQYFAFDTIRIEVQSLSERAFNYFELFQSQTSSLQTGSGSSPSAIRNNLQNVTDPSKPVLGYFGSTSIKQRTRIILP